MAFVTSGLPIDWTNGTGTFSGTTISIPANNNRKWLFIQNRDVNPVTVGLAGVRASDFTTPSVLNFSVDPAGAAGRQGGSLEFNLIDFIPLGTVTVTGTAGSQVLVLEG